MLTNETRYIVRCLGPKIRFSITKPGITVFWVGFKTPTFEPSNIEYEYLH